MSQTLIVLLVILIIVVFLIWLFRCKSGGPCCGSSTTPDTPQPLASEEATDKGQTEGPAESKPAAMEKPKGDADNLKKINGIGPKIEQTLNKLGIFHYQQIADFTEENIDWVDNHLNFKGRIQRDNWVGQSKELVNGS